MQAIDPVGGGIWTYTSSGNGRNALAVGDYVVFNNGFSGSTWTAFDPVTDTNHGTTMSSFTLHAWASYGGYLYVIDDTRGIRKYEPWTGTVVDQWLFPIPSPYWGNIRDNGYAIGGAIYWGTSSPTGWFRFDPSTGAMSQVLSSPTGGSSTYGNLVEMGGLMYQRVNDTTMSVHDPDTGLWREDTFPGSTNFTDSSLPYGIGSWFCAADGKLWFPTSHPVVW